MQILIGVSGLKYKKWSGGEVVHTKCGCLKLSTIIAMSKLTSGWFFYYGVFSTPTVGDKLLFLDLSNITLMRINNHT